jgi:four helix bundle protein
MLGWVRLPHASANEYFGFSILDFGSYILRMTETEFKERTKQIGLRIIKLVESLPSTRSAEIIGKQLLRSGTSVGANYRAACRGKSTADVLHKLAIVEEEADETLYWMELLIDSKIVPGKKLMVLMSDVNEIVAMTVASIRTLRRKQRSQSKIQNPKSKI